MKKIKTIDKKELIARRTRFGVVVSVSKLTQERRIWYFRCKVCGKARRQSHKKLRAIIGICAKCRREQPNEDQAKLFTN